MKTASYLIALTATIAMCWWLWPPLGMAVVILKSGDARRLVIPNAAFWTTAVILTVGLFFGTAMAVGINIGANAAGFSKGIRIVLLIEAFFAVGYVGFEPAPEDRGMYNKAGQTATVGMVCYMVSNITMFLVGRH